MVARIEFPAPEEALTYKEYIALFRARNPGEDFKKACTYVSHDVKKYYDWCWQQPEAMMIRQAFLEQHN
jgi:hypothetical protein